MTRVTDGNGCEVFWHAHLFVELHNAVARLRRRGDGLERGEAKKTGERTIQWAVTKVDSFDLSKLKDKDTLWRFMLAYELDATAPGFTPDFARDLLLDRATLALCALFTPTQGQPAVFAGRRVHLWLDEVNTGGQPVQVKDNELRIFWSASRSIFYAAGDRAVWV